MKTSTNPDLRSLSLERARALLGHADSEQWRAFEADPVAHLQSLIDSLCDLSLQDPLTGLSNRRHFFSVLERELDRVNRTGSAALLLMIDIDHFKHINDLHGHTVGDEAIRVVGRVIRDCVRAQDHAGRYGGDEFVVVCSNARTATAQAMAERIREQIATVRLRELPGLRLTSSIGLAEAQPHQRQLRDWINDADAALYRAKHLGRNQVSAFLAPAAAANAALSVVPAPGL